MSGQDWVVWQLPLGRLSQRKNDKWAFLWDVSALHIQPNAAILKWLCFVFELKHKFIIIIIISLIIRTIYIIVFINSSSPTMDIIILTITSWHSISVLWPFVRNASVDKKASNTELWCFSFCFCSCCCCCYCQHEHAGEQTIGLPGIWDAKALVWRRYDACEMLLKSFPQQ